MDIPHYAVAFPLAPLGGMFVGCVGICIMLGGFAWRFRMPLLWIGFPFALTTIAFFGGRFSAGIAPPSRFQTGALVLAIIFEFAAFPFLMPRLRRQGERAVLVGTLSIVGAHFLIMTPAFGPLITILGLLCLANAAITWRARSYASQLSWFVDGGLKLSLGAGMLSVAPYFH